MIQLDSEWAFTKLKKNTSKKEKDSEWDIQWWFFNWCGVIVSHKMYLLLTTKPVDKTWHTNDSVASIIIIIFFFKKRSTSITLV